MWLFGTFFPHLYHAFVVLVTVQETGFPIPPAFAAQGSISTTAGGRGNDRHHKLDCIRSQNAQCGPAGRPASVLSGAMH